MMGGTLLKGFSIKTPSFAVAGVVGLLATLQGLVESHRPYPADLTGATSFRVYSSSDHGAGSLREAILSADRAGTHGRIDILVEKIKLTAPLPPLINPNGIKIASKSEAVIDASQLESGSVLEVRCKGVELQNLAIENALQSAIFLTSPGLQVAKCRFTNCNTAIEVGDGGGDLAVDDSNFEKNRIGLRADSYLKNVFVTKCKFVSQTQAGVWAVAQGAADLGLALDIGKSQFKDNRFGVVAANHPARIHDNEFSMSHEAAVQLFDRGAVVEHNQIADGFGSGVEADNTSEAVIADNEIYRNKKVAIIMKNSDGGMVRRNSIYANFNGIAFVYGRPGKPDTATGNSIFSQIGDGIFIVGQQPVLKDNVVRSNNAGTRGAPPAPVPEPNGKVAQ